GEDRDQSAQAAILGHERDPPADRVDRRSDRHRRAVDEDRAGLRGLEAEDGLGDLAPAGADQARDAEDLAAANGEADVLEAAAQREALDAQDRRGAGRARLRIQLAYVAADHRADDCVRIPLGNRTGRDELAVAEYGDPV